MAYRRELDDSQWGEVININSYALFMGYISMAIKGLGFLILTWTTVVLLGGFVSMLQKKDFWCLAFITLVQTAGIFDVYQNEKLSYITNSAAGLSAGAIFGLMGDVQSIDFGKRLVILLVLARLFLAIVFVLIQTLVLAILLCPLAAIYMSGLLISTGISIWRLIQHDYGGNSDGEANLKPAMDTLYYLALLQGVLFGYRFLFSLTRKRLARQVVAEYDDYGESEVVLTYLRETRIGCDKDPSFAKGRNLITHAIDLIGSKSRDECLSGVKMLYTAICMGKKRLMKQRFPGDEKDHLRRWEEIIGQHMMIQNLIKSAPSSPVLHKLLQTLDPHGVFDRETRNQGATIVAQLARDVHLEQFPWAIQYICTLIGSFEEYRLIEPYHRDRLLRRHDQDWDRQASRQPSPGNDSSDLREAYEKLVLTGLCILRKLATHEDNCRIMSHTQGLLPRIMAPLTSDIIHEFIGCAWSVRAVQGSLRVMLLLVAAPGKTGANLRRQMSSNMEAIGTMQRILNCDCCSAKLQRRAMGVLTQLHLHNQENGKSFIKMILDIFADDSKDRSIRNLAGEALAKLCIQGGSNITIILQVNADVVDMLTGILLLDDAENKTCRIRAAEILEQMCIHHTQDDASLDKLKKDMTNTMPKVLEQIFRCGLTEPNQVEFPKKEADIENQCDNPQGNVGNKTSSSIRPPNNEGEGEVKAEVAVKVKEEVVVKGEGKGKVKVEVETEVEMDELDNDEDEELNAPLLSLFVTVCDVFISVDEDLSCQFGANDAISFPRRLKDMVAENCITTVPCLRLMKVICKMVISMMEHRGSYRNEDLESLMEALSGASKSMSFLDRSMVFASEDHGAGTTMKPVKSLHSLVNEAKKKVATYFKPQEPFTSTDG